MDYKFERQIHALNEVAKSDRSIDDHDESERRQEADIQKGMIQLELVLRDMIRYSKLPPILSKSAAETVYYLQVQKQDIMRRLRQDLAGLDRGIYSEAIKPGEIHVEQHDGKLIANCEDGYQDEVTLGEIIGDLEWEVDYNLDAKSCDRMTMKQWLIGRAKNEIFELFNDQMVLHALADGNQYVYDNLNKTSGNRPSQNNGENGIVFETASYSYLTQLNIDHHLDISVKKATARMDSNFKLDLIETREQADIDQQDRSQHSTKSVGLQLTIAQNKEALRKKRQQVNKIRDLAKQSYGLDDVQLLQLSPEVSTALTEAFRQWSIHKRPGGPLKLLSPDIKHRLFTLLLSNLFAEDEIEDRWNKINGLLDKKVNAPVESESSMDQNLIPNLSELHPILPEIIRHEDSAQAAD